MSWLRLSPAGAVGVVGAEPWLGREEATVSHWGFYGTFNKVFRELNVDSSSRGFKMYAVILRTEMGTVSAERTTHLLISNHWLA